VSERTDQSSQTAGPVAPVQPRPDSYFGPSRDIAWSEIGELDAPRPGVDADPLRPIADLSWSMLTVPINAAGFADHALAWDDAAWASGPAPFVDLAGSEPEWSALPPDAEPATPVERRWDRVASPIGSIKAEETGMVADGPPFGATAGTPSGPIDAAPGPSRAAHDQSVRETAPSAGTWFDVTASFARDQRSADASAEGMVIPALEVDRAFGTEPHSATQAAGDLPPDVSSPPNSSLAPPALTTRQAENPTRMDVPASGTDRNALTTFDAQPPPAFAAPTVEAIQRRAAERPEPNTVVPARSQTGDRQEEVSPVGATPDDPRSTGHSAGTAMTPERAARTSVEPSGQVPATRTIAGPLPIMPRDDPSVAAADRGPAAVSSAAPRDAASDEQQSPLSKWRALYLSHPGSDLDPLTIWKSLYLPVQTRSPARPERAAESQSSSVGVSPGVLPAPAEAPVVASAGSRTTTAAGEPNIPDPRAPAVPLTTTGALSDSSAFDVAPNPRNETSSGQPSVQRSVNAEPDIANPDQWPSDASRNPVVSSDAAGRTIQRRAVPDADRLAPGSPPRQERVVSAASSEPGAGAIRHDGQAAPDERAAAAPAFVAYSDQSTAGSGGAQHAAEDANFADDFHPVREVAQLSSRSASYAAHDFDPTPALSPDIASKPSRQRGEPTIAISGDAAPTAEPSDASGGQGSRLAAPGTAARYEVRSVQPAPSTPHAARAGDLPSDRKPMRRPSETDEVEGTPDIAGKVERIWRDVDEDGAPAASEQPPSHRDHSSVSQSHAADETRSGRIAIEERVLPAAAVGIGAASNSGTMPPPRPRQQPPSSEAGIGVEEIRQLAAGADQSRESVMPRFKPDVAVVRPRELETDRSPDHAISTTELPFVRSRDQPIDAAGGSIVSPRLGPQAAGAGETAATDLSAAGDPHAAAFPSVAAAASSRPRAESGISPNDQRSGVDRAARRKANGEAPPIRVSIGRITVEAPSASALPQPFRRPRPTLSLNDYLERRRRSE
jgi:hypothetical protein